MTDVRHTARPASAPPDLCAEAGTCTFSVVSRTGKLGACTAALALWLAGACGGNTTGGVGIVDGTGAGGNASGGAPGGSSGSGGVAGAPIFQPGGAPPVLDAGPCGSACGYGLGCTDSGVCVARPSCAGYPQPGEAEYQCFTVDELRTGTLGPRAAPSDAGEACPAAGDLGGTIRPLPPGYFGESCAHFALCGPDEHRPDGDAGGATCCYLILMLCGV